MDDAARELLRDSVPGLLEVTAAAGLALLGVDPITSAVMGRGLGTALALDQLGMQQRAERAGRVVAEASTIVGGEAELVSAAIANEKGLAFTHVVLGAAAESTYQQKREALSRLLAQGLNDDLIDESLILVRALSDVEEPHALLLLDMAMNPRPDALFDEEPEVDRKYSLGWHVGHVQRRRSVSEGIAQGLLTVLDRQALIEHSRGVVNAKSVVGHPRGSKGDRWDVSPFGREVLALLGFEAAAPELGPEDGPIGQLWPRGGG